MVNFDLETFPGLTDTSLCVGTKEGLGVISKVEGHSGVSERSHGLAKITQEVDNMRQGTSKISLPTATYICQGKLPSPRSAVRQRCSVHRFAVKCTCS